MPSGSHVDIKPATPRPNGKVERSHRIDQSEQFHRSHGDYPLTSTNAQILDRPGTVRMGSAETGHATNGVHLRFHRVKARLP